MIASFYRRAFRSEGAMSSRLFSALFLLSIYILLPRAVLAGEDRQVPVDAAMREAIVDTVVAELNCCYIDPEVAVAIEVRLRANLAKGVYDEFTYLSPFLKSVREDLREISNDRHLGVWPIWYAPVPLDSSEEARERWLRERRRENFGIVRVERLPGNVGYMKIDAFVDPRWAEPTVTAALNLLANADALVFDLRENHGGSCVMVNTILGHLFGEPVHTITIYTRYTDETRDCLPPDNLAGPKLTGLPVYALTSGATASGGEHFAFSLQEEDRGTVVGEKTRGAANPTEERVYPGLSINIALPVSRAYHPETGRDWEGTGVAPDVEAPAEEALGAAHVMALKAIRHQTGDAARAEELTELIEKLGEIYSAQKGEKGE